MPYSDNYKKKLIAFSPEEWKIVLHKSSKAKLKPNTYIRQISVQGVIKHYDTTPFNKLMVAINRYGNNLS